MSEEHKQKYLQFLKPVSDDLRKIGFEINKGDFTHLKAKDGVVLPLQSIGIEQEADDLQYLSKKYHLLPKEAVDVLIQWIPRIEYTPSQEVLIHQLSKTKVKYNGNILLDVFKKTNSSLVRDRIGFVLYESEPDINLVELEEILVDTRYEQQKSTLILAGVKFLPKDKINPILLREFDRHFLRALTGLKKTGGQRELEFLKDRLNKGGLDKKQKKEIEKAIDQIDKRLK